MVNGPAAGAAPGGQPDFCTSYLTQPERAYAIAADGAVHAPDPYVATTLAPVPYGYGYPYGPELWVRVPIVREPVAAGD